MGLLFATLVGFTRFAHGAEVASGQATETRADPTDDLRSALTLLNYLSTLPGGVPPVDEDAEEVNRAYNSGAKNPTAYQKYQPTPTFGKDSTYAQTARECGESGQKQCSPDNFGGRTMCGRAVATMIKCMSNRLGAKGDCNGGCGNGKDYVNCTNGQMSKCGYSKLDPKDARCKLAGAVLSYAQSPTARGSVYGHVEFLCGDNRYCSVYREPHDKPWPRYPADTCWVPADAATKGG